MDLAHLTAVDGAQIEGFIFEKPKRRALIVAAPTLPAGATTP